jgi:valyl-tRNA synthetase
MNAQNIEVKPELKNEYLDFTDEWIISRFQNSLVQMNSALDRFDITGATKIIYSYVWSDFCDWYIELAKNRLYSDEENVKSAVLTRALSLFEDMLKMIHPFMPFLSEEVWHLMDERKNDESISVTMMPEPNEQLINKDAEKEIELVQSVVTAIRNIRGEMNIPPSKQISVHIKTDGISVRQTSYIKSLGKVEELIIGGEIHKPKSSASSVVKGFDIYIPLEGLIDLTVERSRIEKEIARLEGLHASVTKKLSNENFVSRAPQDVVEKEKLKQKDWDQSLSKLKQILKDLN